jgi:hypothetical protein
MRALLIVSALALGTLAVGCDRTTEDIPDTGGRRDAPIGDDAGTDAPSADDGGTDTGIDDAGERDTSGFDGGTECEDPRGCWACAPTEPEHFLNGCTDATCEPFAVSTTTLPHLNADGSLPPLP